MKTIGNFLRIALIISIFGLIIFTFEKNKMPPQNEIDNRLLQEPAQTEVRTSAFEVKEKDFIYKMKPQNEYEVYGLVAGEEDNHIDRDPLNIKNVCIVWGENIKNSVYR